MPRRNSPHLHVLHGAAPSKRNDDAPVPALAEPVAPDWLDPEEQVIWGRVTEDLRAMQLLARADTEAILGYVRASRIAEVAYERAKTVGPVVLSHLGDQRPNPAWVVWERTTNRMLAISKELGLTPASRQTLRLPKRDIDATAAQFSA